MRSFFCAMRTMSGTRMARMCFTFWSWVEFLGAYSGEVAGVESVWERQGGSEEGGWGSLTGGWCGVGAGWVWLRVCCSVCSVWPAIYVVLASK